MKISFNTYEQSPQFKASFAKTPQTKAALKELCNKHHTKLYDAKCAFKNAPVKDVIEVSIIQSPEHKNLKDFLFVNTTTGSSARLFDPNGDVIGGFTSIKLSNGKKVSDYTPKNPIYLDSYTYSFFEKNLREEAGTVEDHKAISKLHDVELSEKLEPIRQKEKDYLMKDLDLLD